MTHAVLEGEQAVYIQSVGFGLFLRIKDNRYGIIDQSDGTEILPTTNAFIWHCPETNRGQVWVINDKNEVGIFDLIIRRFVAPVMFSQVFPFPENPYLFTVISHGKRGIYNTLTQELTWKK